ncbi:MAG: ABC transporter permease [Chloroflexi bacterium]|nr:ABC transporter permease [Chloroflexota bacterium]
MTKHVIGRLLVSIPMLLGITIIIFVLANLMPGDAIGAMMTDQSILTEETMELQRARLGLDKPMAVRYLLWVQQLLRGNMGYSYVSGRPIAKAVGERIVPTLELMGVSLIFSLIIGISLGIVSALKQYSIVDYVLTIFGFAGISMPVFFVGMLLMHFFALKLRWLPTSGMATPGIPFSLADNLKHLALPAVAIGILRIAAFMRYTRASMLDVLKSDYLVTARSKGLPERVVLIRHALRNALIPIVTVVGLTLPALLAGAVFIETIFQWPGMGRLYITAVTHRDYPMIMGVALVTTMMVLFSNLLVDITYTFADPRIRYR